MLLLLYLSIKRKIKTDLITTLLLIACLTSALFCISVLLGYAQNTYLSERGINYSSTVTVDSDMSLDNAEIIADVEKINKQCGNKIANALYIAGSDDNVIVIGWYGNKISNWFPTTSSRFFTSEETAGCENVVYMPYVEHTYADDGSVSQQLIRRIGETVILDGEEYKIIETGWITADTFISSISSRSSQQLFSEQSKRDAKIRIIPYSTFMKKYRPSLILLHFQDMSYEELTQCCEMITKDSSLGPAYPPDTDSGQMLRSEKAQELIIALFLTSLAGITIIQLMNQWLRNNRKQYMIYMICGLSELQTLALTAAEWFAVFTVGVCLAELLHLSLLKPFSYLGAGHMPALSDILITAVLLYGLSTLIMAKQIKNLMRSASREEIS